MNCYGSLYTNLSYRIIFLTGGPARKEIISQALNRRFEKERERAVHKFRGVQIERRPTSTPAPTPTPASLMEDSAMKDIEDLTGQDADNISVLSCY